MKDESLGHKIKKLRKKKSLSQERLADKADLSQQHISRIEKYAYEILRKLDFLNIAEKSKVSGYIDRILEDSRLI